MAPTAAAEDGGLTDDVAMMAILVAVAVMVGIAARRAHRRGGGPRLRRARDRRLTHHPAVARLGGDRGAVAVSVVVVPILMTVLLTVLQVAIWYHGQSVATAAAQHGLDAARVPSGTRPRRARRPSGSSSTRSVASASPTSRSTARPRRCRSP